MKILVLMGSPRKGESYAVVRKVEERMQAAHAAAAQNNPQDRLEFEYLWLKEIHFGQCLGCHACIRFGEEKCPLRDDRPAVLARMLAADGLIITTPVYALQVSYLVKILFDGYCFLWHRPRFFGKFVMGVASGGGQFKETLGYIKQNVKAWGATYVTGIGAPHPDALVPKRRKALEQSIDTAARHFYTTVRLGHMPKPSLFDLTWFRMWRLNALAGKSFTPRDLAYWSEKGWMERDYFTPTPLNPLQRAFGWGMEKLLRAFMRSVYMGY